MARLKFDALFIKHPDGTVEPRVRIRIGGVEIGPGVRFGKGVIFGGINIAQFINNDLEVETDGNVFVIKGIYNNG